MSKSKSQREMFYDASRRNAEANITFLEMVNQGLTKNELQKLVARRPTLWGRFSNWLPKLP